MNNLKTKEDKVKLLRDIAAGRVRISDLVSRERPQMVYNLVTANNYVCDQDGKTYTWDEIHDYFRNSGGGTMIYFEDMSCEKGHEASVEITSIMLAKLG